MAKFNIFRYQILPIDQEVQLQLFDPQEILDIVELRQRKNEFFFDAITKIDSFHWSRAELVHRVLYASEDMIVLRIGADRGVKRTKRDFEPELLDDWPSALVIINNDPHVQQMAIEVEYKAFRKTRTLAAILEKNLNEYLYNYLLSVTILPIFDQYDFWEVVEKYENRITQVTFDMVSPNMSNISKSLKFDLRALNRQTNTQETRLELKSDERSYLTLSPEDDFVDSLVDYSSKGGGNIGVKVKGVTKKITTNDTVTEIQVDEIETSILTADQAQKAAIIVGEFFT